MTSLAKDTSTTTIRMSCLDLLEINGFLDDLVVLR